MFDDIVEKPGTIIKGFVKETIWSMICDNMYNILYSHNFQKEFMLPENYIYKSITDRPTWFSGVQKCDI